MEKLCRSVTTLYRLPRISHLNLRLNSTIAPYSSNSHNQLYGSPMNLSARSNCFNNHITIRQYGSQKPPSGGNMTGAYKQQQGEDQEASIGEILDREIQDEMAEMNQHLSTDQFPGFSVETDGADVKLTKQVRGATVTVRFTVSSSLNEWPSDSQRPQEPDSDQQDPGTMNTSLVSMPEFQVQITRNKHTLELSCFFEEMELDDETGEPLAMDPVFSIDELVMYEGEPKETEFSVSTDYLQEDLQEALSQYLSEYGINDEFSRNLVGFATSYEKKQYVSLMKRLRNFVGK